ncbi:MAG: flagellar biosynthetic protein FliO [Planctomycetota bacterium]|jgi:flagellar biogenesis protein FliO
MVDTLWIGLASVANLDTSPAGVDWPRYVLVCTGLISLILLAGIGVKRLMRGSVVARANKRSLQIHDVLPLGGRQKLAVVRCYDRTFVLGLGDREVTLVGELEAETDLARTRETEQEAAQPAPKAALAALGKLSGRSKDDPERKAQFVDLLRRLGEVQPQPARQSKPAKQARAAEPTAVPHVADEVARPMAAAEPTDVEHPAPARPATVGEALRREGVLG